MVIRTLAEAQSPRRIGRRLLRSGLLEALAYPHGVDRYTELIRPLMLARDVRAEVVGVRLQTPKSVTLTLRPNANWEGFRAGQFVGLSASVAGVRVSRPYSLAGSEHATDGTLEMTVSTHPMGRLSRHLREHVRAGMVVDLTQAQGEFVLPDRRPEGVLLISGGSGITPVMAMLRTLCDEREVPKIGFLNYARSPLTALYEGELRQLESVHPGLRVARGFTRSTGGQITRAPLSRAPIRRDRSARGSRDFACGPPALVESVRTICASERLAEPAIETFSAGPCSQSTPRTHAASCASPPADSRSPNSGLPAAGAGRGCGTDARARVPDGHLQHLQLPKTAGTVRNVISGAVRPPDEEQIRICVSVPVGDVVLDI